MSTQRLLDTFLEMVRIDSPSGREGALARRCAGLLADLGMDVRYDSSAAATGSDTGNLVAEMPGSGSGRCVILSAHMDCVQPCEGVEPLVQDGRVRSAGQTVLGADDKAGIAAIVEAVRRLREEPGPYAGVRVLLTVQEEVGLRGAKALEPSDVRGDLAVVLDAGGPVGGIVIGSPTHYTFEATFRGRAAHAGVEPEAGASAIGMAARAIAAMPMGRLDDATTSNIGTIEGGVATNVVAASAKITGECRSLDNSRVEEVRVAIGAALDRAAAAGGGSVEVAWSREYAGFRLDPEDEVVRIAVAACEAAGVEPRTFSTGGGSDGNIIAALGVPTIVLASGMTAVHGTEESIAVDELERLAQVTCNIVRMAVV